jgi:hypothetical protein
MLRPTTLDRTILRPLVYVRVGNGPRVPVMLDTGSTGLWIFRAGLDLHRGGGVTLSGRPAESIYQGGTLREGEFATAKVTIGGLTTRRAVRIGVIERMGCSADRPHCGKNDLSLTEGVYGLLGVSLRQIRDGLENPLLALPAPYASGWSIGLGSPSPARTLGAQPPKNPTLALSFPLDSTQSGGGFDDTGGQLCWHFEAANPCLPTLFDSGSPAIFWFGPFSPAGVAERGVSPGSVVSLAANGSNHPFWRFIAGGNFSRSAIIREPVDPLTHFAGEAPSAAMRQVSFVNTGIQAFYAFTVTYDAVHGRLYLRPSRPTTDGRVTVPSELFAANRVCVQGGAQLARALASIPPARSHDLGSAERYASLSQQTWARLSLSIDERLARLRLSAAAEPIVARAIAADRAGSSFQLAVARALPTYRTWRGFEQAAARFWPRYYALENGWVRNMDRLGIGGCAT